LMDVQPAAIKATAVNNLNFTDIPL
jgi:hypothetical protein